VKREYIETLGLYKPTEKANKFQCKKDRVDFWIGQGAQLSETVNNLLCDFGVFAKDKKIKIVHGKKLKKKDAKKDSVEGGVKTVDNQMKDQEESKVEGDQEKVIESEEKVETDGENSQNEQVGEVEEISSEDK